MLIKEKIGLGHGLVREQDRAPDFLLDGVRAAADVIPDDPQVVEDIVGSNDDRPFVF